MKPNRYAVPALEKGLDLLETLADARTPQSLAELSKTLARSPNELFRMLNCLERRGYLTKDAASARYSLTLKLFELAHTHSPVDKILEGARTPMAELVGKVGESCHLSILRRGELLVIAQAEKTGSLRISVEVGATFDPLTTASGRLLLAFLPPTELAEIAGSALSKGLLETLQTIRKEGISTAEGETHVGVLDVSALVGNPEVGVTAALAVTSLARTDRVRPKRQTFEQTCRHLRATVAAINRNLHIKSTS